MVQIVCKSDTPIDYFTNKFHALYSVMHNIVIDDSLMTLHGGRRLFISTQPNKPVLA